MSKRKPAESTLPETIHYSDGTAVEYSGIYRRTVRPKEPETPVPPKLLKAMQKYPADINTAFAEYHKSLTKAERKQLEVESQKQIAAIEAQNASMRESSGNCLRFAEELAKRKLSEYGIACDGNPVIFTWKDGTTSWEPDPRDFLVPLEVRDAAEILGLIKVATTHNVAEAKLAHFFLIGQCVERLSVRPFERYVKQVKHSKQVLAKNAREFTPKQKTAALAMYDQLVSGGTLKKKARPEVRRRLGVADSTLRLWLRDRKNTSANR